MEELKKVKTCNLVKELMAREGVEHKWIDPETDEGVATIVLTITD